MQVLKTDRVLFAYRSDVDTQGGAAKVLEETRKALVALGVYVDVTHDVRPECGGYDVVHVFNIWFPQTALEQLRHVKSHASGAVVWSPFYLHWCEYAWATVAVPVLFDGKLPRDEKQRFKEAFEKGEVAIDGVQRWSPNEVYVGFHDDVKEMLDCVDHVCASSHREVQTLFQITKEATKRFTVTRHGVNGRIYRGASEKSFRERFGVSEFVLCVGAVEMRKNQLLLVEALRDSGLQVVLVGPSFEPEYLDLCVSAGGGHLLYLGRLSEEMVASAYKAARVHALPSFAEASALTNLEAAVAGCAVVMSNRSSEFEYFGDAPYFCDPGDFASIRTSVVEAHDRAPRERRRWEELSQAVEQRFTWEQTAKDTLLAYERAFDARATRK